MRRRGAVCVAVAVVAIGCAGGDGGAGAGAGHAQTWADGTPVVWTDDEMPDLPLRKYEFDGGDHGEDAHRDMESAVGLLAQRCMVRHGFAGFPRDPKPFTMAGTVTLTAVSVNTGPVGSYDPEQAGRWGYGWDPARASGPRRHAGRMMTREESEVYYGDRRAEYSGCSGEAYRRIQRGVRDVKRMWTYVTEREYTVRERAEREPRLRRAYRAWADCVVDKGFKRYTDPVAASSDKAWRRGKDGNTKHTRRETGTAVADVECKRAHNTAGVWWAVTERLQRRELVEHKAEFDSVRADRDRLLSNVREVMAAG
ncbi:hypothetical protein [Streptomyces sp. NPDC016845]|uniref:hypothetical protein n=1 Tax=Streptomyces sp. NPDC016845 TaxID=3364972 RepID=UPI00379B1FB9